MSCFSCCPLPRPDDTWRGRETCYSDVSAVDLLEDESQERKSSLLRHIRRSGHSPFEHASFTFAMDG